MNWKRGDWCLPQRLMEGQCISFFFPIPLTLTQKWFNFSRLLRTSSISPSSFLFFLHYSTSSSSSSANKKTVSFLPSSTIYRFHSNAASGFSLLLFPSVPLSSDLSKWAALKREERGDRGGRENECQAIFLTHATSGVFLRNTWGFEKSNPVKWKNLK